MLVCAAGLLESGLLGVAVDLKYLAPRGNANFQNRHIISLYALLALLCDKLQ